jgi:hypothetical protein
VDRRSNVSKFWELGVWRNQLPRSRETQNLDKILVVDRGAISIIDFLGKYQHFGSRRFITHIVGNANIVVDALSRRCLILQEFKVKTLRFEHLKDIYFDDTDLKEAYEACTNPVLRDRSQLIEYMIQEGLLFKGNQLCIPKFSMRDNLLKENHSGGLVGHFDHDKMFPQLRSSHYWPGMRT